MSIEKLLEERGRIHGSFDDDADIAQTIKNKIHDYPGYHACTEPQQLALDMIAGKIARIVAGDRNHADHWQDIIGYAQLVLDRLAKPLVFENCSFYSERNYELDGDGKPIPTVYTDAEGKPFKYENYVFTQENTLTEPKK